MNAAANTINVETVELFEENELISSADAKHGVTVGKSIWMVREVESYDGDREYETLGAFENIQSAIDWINRWEEPNCLILDPTAQVSSAVVTVDYVAEAGERVSVESVLNKV